MNWNPITEHPSFHTEVEFEAHGKTYIGHRENNYSHATWWIKGKNKGYLENFITRWRYKS